MGDGRYYTFEQFYNVIILTFLIIFILISFMVFVYKESDYKKSIIFLGIVLEISLISEFVAEIYRDISKIPFYKRVTDVTLLVHMLAFMLFYYVLIKVYKKKNIIALVPIISCLISGYLFFFQQQLNMTVFILLVTHYIIVSNRFIRFRIGHSLFDDVKKSINDYIFITDTLGNVIYKSDKVSDADLFTSDDKVNIIDIDYMFRNKVVMRDAFGKKLIKIAKDPVVYLQFFKTEIYNKEKIEGYLLTFTDITELISLLDELSLKEKEIKDSNKELLKYKEIVYDVEKEKEIHDLLNEIAENQQKAMNQLKKDVLNLNIEDKDFKEKVEKLIELAKTDLRDVRGAVTAYMNYYGGGYHD